MAAVRVVGVVKEYGGVKAVTGVDLEVREGEVLGLLGPNGAGKTTLMGMMAGIVTPTSGHVEVMGHDVVREPEEAKSLVSYCPQEGVVYDDLTGIENLVFFAGLYGLSRSETKRRVNELLEFFELADVAKRRVGTYSGGMKKRVNLAAALISDPAIPLLDEPTTGLDPHIRRMIWERIVALKGRGKTIVLATHYMEEADELSDRVAIMDMGRIVALDTPERLKQTVGPTAAIELKVAKMVPGLEKALSRYSEGETVHVKESTLRLYVRDPDPLLPRIIREVAQKGDRVISVHIAEPTLEDVFIRLTGRRIEET